MKDYEASERRWKHVETFLTWVSYITLIAVAAMFIVLACTNIVKASPLECESIKNADQRHFCRALSKPQKSECEFIKDPDLRHQCRGRVK